MDTFVSEEEAAQFREYMSDPSARAAFLQFKATAAEDGTARRYAHVLRAVTSRPWAIHEPMLAIIVDVLTFRAFGGRLTAEELEGRIGAARRTPVREAPRGVARIPISGVIMPKASMMSEMSGGTSAEAVGNSIRQAVHAQDVTSIVLDVDSPGGAVDGIPELAALIAEANRIKPITAVANTEAASAAYWLASQAGRIVAAPSARVGSIGVITRHEETSAKDEREGVKTTLVSAGKFKAEGSPWEPLSDDARAHLQAMVDEFYGMFVEGVAQGRGVKAADVRAGFGEGRMVTASQALKLGMIDGIGTMEDVIHEELAGDRPAARRLTAVPTAAAHRPGSERVQDGAEGLPGTHAGASEEEARSLAGPTGEAGPTLSGGGQGWEETTRITIHGSVGDPKAIAEGVNKELQARVPAPEPDPEPDPSPLESKPRTDGSTSYDDEMERLRAELLLEPEDDFVDPTAAPVVAEDPSPEAPDDEEMLAIRDELSSLSLPE